jgi:hypothetical protein
MYDLISFIIQITFRIQSYDLIFRLNIKNNGKETLFSS